MRAQFDNSYARLPDTMFTQLGPTPVANPQLIIQNDALATELGITLEDDLDIFAGNALPDGAAPLAQLYAGHQFGNWNPQLGDGRAVLLGEVIATDGSRHDLQLKGAGRTPYSRGGDGRAWLGPVLREYLVSEAMHALGVPTTRALAAVTTGEDVYRETRLPGAIVTRTAQSHIRVGTFQILAARGMHDELRALTDHVIARHYPDADGPAALLDAVITKQAKLIAKWMSIGFIHGVMNTDNASIAGETVDYGPCAFMDGYHPARVFSAIDQTGRYAYQNQPGIAAWNMAQFATALLPLMPDQDAAIADFTAAVNQLPDIYAAERNTLFAAKLGLDTPDETLTDDLLSLMAADEADFTATFADLHTARNQFKNRDAYDAWHARWTKKSPDPALMAAANPQIIPRNHLIEAAIQAALAGDFAPFHALHTATRAPYAALTKDTQAFAAPPTDTQTVTQTFCGT